MSSHPMKICFVLGTRPEITKLYSVINAAHSNPLVEPVVIHTGQHYDYEMSQVFLEELKLPPFQHFLSVKSDSHGRMTAALLTELEKTLSSEKPDVTVVLGDTNTTLAGALAAAKLDIPVAHVEAGCRSFDYAMPEEINRLVADSISSIFFAPSEIAALNLLFEGKPANKVHQAGNTVVDIVEETKSLRNKKKRDFKEDDAYDVIVTLHRQENVDNRERLSALLLALNQVKGRVVFPIHPRTQKRIEEFQLGGILDNSANVTVTKPLNYLSFMTLIEMAKVVITDSGGVQEEAVMVGTPCITARDTTEWPETVWSGGNHLTGQDTALLIEICNEYLSGKRTANTEVMNPFKGNAGISIIKTLVDLWKAGKLRHEKPDMSNGRYPLPHLLSEDHISPEEYVTSLRFGKNGEATTDKRHSFTKVVRRLTSKD